MLGWLRKTPEEKMVSLVGAIAFDKKPDNKNDKIFKAANKISKIAWEDPKLVPIAFKRIIELAELIEDKASGGLYVKQQLADETAGLFSSVEGYLGSNTRYIEYLSQALDVFQSIGGDRALGSVETFAFGENFKGSAILYSAPLRTFNESELNTVHKAGIRSILSFPEFDLSVMISRHLMISRHPDFAALALDVIAEETENLNNPNALIMEVLSTAGAHKDYMADSIDRLLAMKETGPLSAAEIDKSLINIARNIVEPNTAKTAFNNGASLQEIERTLDKLPEPEKRQEFKAVAHLLCQEFENKRIAQTKAAAQQAAHQQFLEETNVRIGQIYDATLSVNL